MPAKHSSGEAFASTVLRRMDPLVSDGTLAALASACQYCDRAATCVSEAVPPSAEGAATAGTTPASATPSSSAANADRRRRARLIMASPHGSAPAPGVAPTCEE